MRDALRDEQARIVARATEAERLDDPHLRAIRRRMARSETPVILYLALDR